MSVAAALAIACSTRPVSSDEDTARLTRASVRSRSKSLSNSSRGVGRTEVTMECRAGKRRAEGPRRCYGQ